MPISFSWSLDAGQVLTAVSVVLGGLYAVWGMQAEVKNVGQRMAKVENEITKLSEVILSNARLEERYTALALRTTALEASGTRGPGGEGR